MRGHKRSACQQSPTPSAFLLGLTCLCHLELQEHPESQSACVHPQWLSPVRLCNLIHCGLPGSSVHGIFQARILGWVAPTHFLDGRGSSGPEVKSMSPALAGRFFTTESLEKPQVSVYPSLTWECSQCTKSLQVPDTKEENPLICFKMSH